MKNKNISKNKKIVYLALMVILVLSSTLIVNRYISQDNPNLNQNSNNTDAQPNNFDSNEIKKKIVEDQKNDNNSTQSGNKSVTPLITYAGQEDSNIVVATYVPGISEDGGTCTLVATQQQNKVTKSVTANRNTSTTDCSQISIPLYEFPTTGDWQLSVTYNSSTANGSSDKWTLKVE